MRLFLKRLWRQLQGKHEAECMAEGCRWHIVALDLCNTLERCCEHNAMTGHSVAYGRDYIERWRGL